MAGYLQTHGFVLCFYLPQVAFQAQAIVIRLLNSFVCSLGFNTKLFVTIIRSLDLIGQLFDINVCLVKQLSLFIDICLQKGDSFLQVPLLYDKLSVNLGYSNLTSE